MWTASRLSRTGNCSVINEKKYLQLLSFSVINLTLTLDVRAVNCPVAARPSLLTQCYLLTFATWNFDICK